jgi:hypothetical protein
MTAPIGLLLHTAHRHGVARYARELAAAAAGPMCIPIPEPSWAAPSSIDRVHAHFTDRLWGPTPEAAAGRLLEIAGSRRLSVTLHDLPQPSDGSAFARRSEAYRRVVDAADTVIVNSRHEQALLDDFHPGSPTPSVIPLPVHRRRGPGPSVLEPVVAVLGFVYPGKGHREVVTAISASGTDLAFRALGAPSAGHEGEADDLVGLGRELGVDVRITGYLSDRRLRTAASTAAVPVVAHQHLSASGSINSWISAGRRPLAIRSRYTEEMEALRPGTLRLVRAGELAQAIADAAGDPRSTLLGPDPSTRPHLGDAASAYIDLWRRTAAVWQTR